MINMEMIAVYEVKIDNKTYKDKHKFIGLLNYTKDVLKQLEKNSVGGFYYLRVKVGFNKDISFKEVLEIAEEKTIKKIEEIKKEMIMEKNHLHIE